MAIPNVDFETESNRVSDNMNVNVLSREDGVFEVTNLSHENPSEHNYKIFCDDDGEAFHCACPAFKHESGLDKSGNCKHMRVVEQFVRHLQYRDWQVEKRESDQEMREDYEREETEAEQEILHEFGNAEPEDPDTVVFAEEPEPSEQSELPDFEEYMRDQLGEDWELDAGEELDLDDGNELSSGAQAAQEMLEEGVLKSKDEWREMSSEGRERYVAML